MPVFRQRQQLIRKGLEVPKAKDIVLTHPTIKTIQKKALPARQEQKTKAIAKQSSKPPHQHHRPTIRDLLCQRNVMEATSHDERLSGIIDSVLQGCQIVE